MKAVILCLVLGLLGACSRAETYHYSIFILKASLIQTPAEAGEGNPTVCKYLFRPPGVYTGPVISIPQSAIPFGVVAVTDGKTSAIVPLFTWTDEDGAKHCGCNGPSPQFARSAKTEEDLIHTMGDLLRKKTPNA